VCGCSRAFVAQGTEEFAQRAAGYIDWHQYTDGTRGVCEGIPLGAAVASGVGILHFVQDDRGCVVMVGIMVGMGDEAQ